MTLSVITSNEAHGCEAQERQHLDAMACTHTLLGVPAWVRDRPSQGGTHSLATCERCANSARIRAMFAKASIDECKLMKEEDKEQALRQQLRYERDRDHRRNVMRMCLHYVAVAEKTPVRKLPSAIKELRLIAATHKVHADLGNGAQARTLQMWASASADVAWERYRLHFHAS